MQPAAAYWLFCVLLGEVLDEPDVPPAEPLVLLPLPDADPSLPAGSLAPLEEPELGEGEDELPEALELGELPDAPPEAEPELDGLLGVVALPLLELPLVPDEPERFVASPEGEDPEEAPELPDEAPSPRSQP